jgi:hypothetical protein
MPISTDNRNRQQWFAFSLTFDSLRHIALVYAKPYRQAEGGRRQAILTHLRRRHPFAAR